MPRHERAVLRGGYPRVDERRVRQPHPAGALGGKLIGAGGGGFLMFYAKDTASLRHAMIGAGLEEIRFRFDFEGTRVVI